jgi:undecaprenyl diphosphate synthase
MTLVLALSYSGRWDILKAVQSVVHDASLGKLTPEELTEARFESYLNTINIPDPELLIRTSGEMRISNFMLWQCAYTELYFTEVLWPDFREKHILEAIADFQKRERRFGKTSEQLNLAVK